MYAMLVLRGPQGRLVIPTESPSLNKVFTYFTYLLTLTLWGIAYTLNNSYIQGAQ